jgi:hypothetical protein
MSDSPGLDPFRLARDWVVQWEKLVNQHGAEWLAKPEAAQAMQAATAAALKAQNASNEAMSKLLAAANMPSKADVEALGARLGRIETMIARIEARLGDTPGGATAPRPGPRRTRKPAP